APDHESDKPGSAQTLKDIVRPGFSLPLMTSNFRRFNARIGVVFVFQVRITRLLTWRYPSQTLSFSLIYTFLCLNPHLIPMVPLVATLFFLLVPAYLSRHPPPPSTSITTYSLAGPPLAPARTIKPAPEISKDFFRNMRDLQNSMDDFATMHDLMVKLIAPATNFSNEPLSSALFQVLFLSCCTLFISAQLLPWRLIALIGGWSLLALGHPDVQELFMRSIYVEHVRPTTKAAKSEFEAWYKTDIILDAAPEVREVEIFELQRRTGLFSPSHASSDTPSPSSGTGDRDVGKDADYEPWLFAASAWEPLTPRRVAGERVKGTRFFEDVQPPSGWEWDGVKWELDLGAREWVEERLIGGVKVEVEGERWVFDSDDAEWRRRRWVRKVRRKVMISPAAAAPSVAAKDSDGKK
ncbi:hypothetical protein MMC25_000466, partial [Agyrium rufum]|nr:hypothetical protein [Agyrium rufum]